MVRKSQNCQNWTEILVLPCWVAYAYGCLIFQAVRDFACLFERILGIPPTISSLKTTSFAHEQFALRFFFMVVFLWTWHLFDFLGRWVMCIWRFLGASKSYQPGHDFLAITIKVVLSSIYDLCGFSLFPLLSPLVQIPATTLISSSIPSTQTTTAPSRSRYGSAYDVACNPPLQ